MKDLRYLIDNNFKTFLIGEFLMKSEKPDKLINNILKYKKIMKSSHFDNKGSARMVDISTKKYFKKNSYSN